MSCHFDCICSVSLALSQAPCGSSQNVPFERAAWICSSLLPPPLMVRLTVSHSAFWLSLKTPCLVTPPLSPLCTMGGQLLVLGTQYGDELCPASILHETGVFWRQNQVLLIFFNPRPDLCCFSKYWSWHKWMSNTCCHEITNWSSKLSESLHICYKTCKENSTPSFV